MADSLASLASAAARQRPEAQAVRGTDSNLSYRALDELANRLANGFAELGARPQDRIGLWLDKSPEAVAAMQGALRAGAAYVPVDPSAPPLRAATVLRDCDPRVVVTTSTRADALAAQGVTARFLTVDGAGRDLAWSELGRFGNGPSARWGAGEDLAYLLYTSGSTGTPKGVCISHRAALAFVRWAAGELQVAPSDVLASHAPFHFDLSVFDLYAAFSSAACVALVPESFTYNPRGLVEWIGRERPTLWYSVPWALVNLIEHGGLLETVPPLRAVLFAGEPFPIEPLKRMRERWPQVRLLNLYGPTETNVCTFYELRESLAGRTRPPPIGSACCGDRVWAVGEDGAPAQVGQEGELLVLGPTVMTGYWGRPPQAEGPYATGDWVRVLDSGAFEFIGRRDEMIKLRGYRVEPAEIEEALRQYPGVEDAAVLADRTRAAPRLVAFLACSGRAPALLELKRHCAERLPRYMIIDAARVLPALPRTRNGKVDRQALRQFLTETEGLRGSA